ncbi:hypothetical protein VW29_10560 [Devosia limi DSM 17137]|uniref:Integrase DNA-binding domain-containing protein n=1 Tax=Devosia limi DSM 17137 TaxID=1121477 RepID=A0A0F5LPY6_9HYPH|nr:Arm DNA-binding domain-containing protein [Devosia limi]KKB84393.1 hypothetical protein VW29_10560 [Devosia limi DSM 17137]SHF61679.1 protein of unknown function [Devosia limi DSM 17137]
MKTGKHPDKALSAVQVRQLKEPGRYADGNGLYLVVDPSGAKRWMLRTVVQGKRRDIGLGGVSLVSLAEAREKALAYRKLAREGGDPLAEKRLAKKVVPTFSEAADTVYAEHKAGWPTAVLPGRSLHQGHRGAWADEAAADNARANARAF